MQYPRKNIIREKIKEGQPNNKTNNILTMFTLDNYFADKVLDPKTLEPRLKKEGNM